MRPNNPSNNNVGITFSLFDFFHVRNVKMLEEIAFKKGFISRHQLLQEAEEMKSTPYGQYLIHRYDS